MTHLKQYAQDAANKGMTGKEYLNDVLGYSKGAHTLERDAKELDGAIAALTTARTGNREEGCVMA